MYVLLAVSVVSLVPIFMYGDDGLDFALIWAYILLGIGVLSAIVMSFINIGKNPGGAKRSLIGLGVLAAVLIISYFLSNTTPVVYSGGKKEYTDVFGLLVTDMGLYTAYFALIGALIAVIVGEVRNSIK